MTDVQPSGNGPGPLKGAKTFSWLVIAAVSVALVAAVLVISTLDFDSLGEDGGYDEYSGGTASEAKQLCQEYISDRRTNKATELRFDDPTVRGEDGWWVVSGDLLVGDELQRVSFNCQIGRETSKTWSYISVCVPADPEVGRSKYLRSFADACESSLRSSKYPPGFGR